MHKAGSRRRYQDLAVAAAAVFSLLRAGGWLCRCRGCRSFRASNNPPHQTIEHSDEQPASELRYQLNNHVLRKNNEPKKKWTNRPSSAPVTNKRVLTYEPTKTKRPVKRPVVNHISDQPMCDVDRQPDNEPTEKPINPPAIQPIMINRPPKRKRPIYDVNITQLAKLIINNSINSINHSTGPTHSWCIL